MAQDAIRTLLEEHRQLKEILERVEQAAAADPLDPEALVAAARNFHETLARHERSEEEVLFPALSGMGPVQLVLQEHARLHALRDALESALGLATEEPSEENARALKGRVDAVAYAFAGHMLKEEQLVFRMAEAMLGPERLAEMGERMAALQAADP
jgi:hemerythrin-like domain-containing protein